MFRRLISGDADGVPRQIGELVSHGPQVFEGCRGHPEATTGSFIAIDDKPFFRPGDSGRRNEEGCFLLT